MLVCLFILPPISTVKLCVYFYFIDLFCCLTINPIYSMIISHKEVHQYSFRVASTSDRVHLTKNEYALRVQCFIFQVHLFAPFDIFNLKAIAFKI